jgi:protein-S-isoprenylcysteine O-methyltransferase Ste14
LGYRIVDWGERLLFLGLFAVFASSNLRSGDIVNYAFIAIEAIAVLMILLRRPAVSVSARPTDWLIAFGASGLPLLARPAEAPEANALAGGLMAIGTLVSVAAKLSLNRRFGVVAANRGVQARGAYAYVRHPMYLGYIIAQAGYLLNNPAPWNASIIGAAWCLQILRIGREERHLMLDEDYQAYAARTRFRILPGIY